MILATLGLVLVLCHGVFGAEHLLSGSQQESGQPAHGVASPAGPQDMQKHTDNTGGQEQSHSDAPYMAVLFAALIWALAWLFERLRTHGAKSPLRAAFPVSRRLAAPRRLPRLDRPLLQVFRL